MSAVYNNEDFVESKHPQFPKVFRCIGKPPLYLKHAMDLMHTPLVTPLKQLNKYPCVLHQLFFGIFLGRIQHYHYNLELFKQSIAQMFEAMHIGYITYINLRVVLLHPNAILPPVAFFFYHVGLQFVCHCTKRLGF